MMMMNRCIGVSMDLNQINCKDDDDVDDDDDDDDEDEDEDEDKDDDDESVYRCIYGFKSNQLQR